MKDIIIKGAREHNLQNISVKLPRDKFIVITGLSGSGKSTLAFDTLYAEGQRRYVESLSAYARQFLGLMNKPDVDSIEGLSPAISIEQKTTSKNPRSTVGTTTEIYDYLRLLFARVGTPYCPDHNIKIESQTPEKIADRIAEDNEGDVTVLSPVVRQKKGTYEKLVSDLNQEGYTRVRVDKKIHRTDEKLQLERYVKHDIEIVIDRLRVDDKSRLVEAVENALLRSDGLIIVLDEHEKERIYSSKMACPVCGLTFEELQPRMFSFNSPFGACDECHGLGIKSEFDPDLIIPDKEKCIADGAIALYRNVLDSWRGQYLGSVAKKYGFDIFTPIKDLTEEQYTVLLWGSDARIKFGLSMKDGDAYWSHYGTWEGLIPQSDRLYNQTESDYRRRELEKFMRVFNCPSCDGKRLKRKVLAVKIENSNISDITDLSIDRCSDFFRELKLNDKDAEIAGPILKEIRERLNFLDRVGLSYLTLSRTSGTLSGGEAQRIRLATQMSIGLHQRDNHKLIETLHKLRDLGNTLIVVEHDEDTIRSADYVIDMGPGAGLHGGKVIAKGTPKVIERSQGSLTGKYLCKQLKIETPKERRVSNNYITVYGCSENNLKGIDVRIPLSVLTLVTGVSGSGKSTLVYEILYKGLMKKLHNSRTVPGEHRDIGFDTPVCSNPRSKD
jgi:excinuclease ABC subunit A